MKNLELTIVKLDTKSAPNRLRLFKFGVNKTTKGEFILTKENAEKIIQEQKEYGNKLNFDYNHSQLNDLLTIEDGLSAGTFDLGILSDGLYAINIEWTNKAKQLIEEKEYIYTSPAFNITKVDGEKYITDIINCALTNMPATKELKQILEAASKKQVSSKKQLNKKELSTMDEEEDKKKETEESLEDSEEKSPMQDLIDRLAALEEIVAELKGKTEEEKPSDESTDEEMQKCEDSTEEEKPSDETEEKKLAKEALLDLAVVKGKILPAQKKLLSKLSLKTLKTELDSMPATTKLSGRLVSQPAKQKSETEKLSDRLISGYKSNFRK